MATHSAMAVTWKGVFHGALKSVSVGSAGVWGVNGADHVYYRIGTYRKPGTPGSVWEHIISEYG